MRHMTIAALTVLTVGRMAVAGGVLVVDDDAAAGGDGLGWDSAYRFLQDALAFASDPANGVAEIRVAQGTYKPDRDEDNPDGTGDREATFELLGGVTLAGGYAGIGAEDPDERDIELYETVLTGDLLGNDGDKGDGFEENSFHVLFAAGEDLWSSVDGVTIERGVANGGGNEDNGAGLLIKDSEVHLHECLLRLNDATDDGGAINCDAGTLVVTGCAFTENGAGRSGGGIECAFGSLTINQSEFSDNSAGRNGGAIDSVLGPLSVLESSFVQNNVIEEGGAVFIVGGSVTIQQSEFVSNTATFNNSDGAGGAIATANDPCILIEECSFTSNSAFEAGAIWCTNSPKLKLLNCVFGENSSSWLGAAVRFGDFEASLVVDGCVFLGNCSEGNSAALEIHSTQGFTVTNCRFEENIAHSPGALRIRTSSGTVNNCDFVGNMTTNNGAPALLIEENSFDVLVANCSFLGNSAPNASGSGGGAAKVSSAETIFINCLLSGNSIVTDFGHNEGGGAIEVEHGSAHLINCSISQNEASSFGGAILVCEGSIGLDNCIIWGNVDSRGGGELSQIHLIDAEATINYSCIEGWSGAFGGVGNIGDDPIFVDADGPDRVAGTEDDDLRLQFGSPCIDAGDNGAEVSCLSELDGLDRRWDDPDTRDTGAGRPPIVDMGAYEFASMPIALDCNDNGLSDLCELEAGLEFDCNGNGFLDVCDIEGGESDDVNENGIPDECDADCNLNGIPDDLDIEQGVSEDLDGNGIPDECEQDCNANGIPDVVDIVKGMSEDCNRNGVPDECDTVPPFFADSGQLAPIGFETPQTFKVLSAPVAHGEVMMSFATVADLASVVEFIDIQLNGILLASLFENDGHDCPVRPDFAELILDKGLFNDLVDGGNAVITAIPSGAVNAGACKGETWLNIQVSYSLGATSDDQNNNGIPDECEMAGDLDGDGDVDAADLILLLGAWGDCDSCEGCLGDLDGDCNVGTSDLVILLGNWG